MRKIGLLVAVSGIVAGLVVTGYSHEARAGGQHHEGGMSSPPVNFVEALLPEGDKAYGVIDGKHLHEYVVEQAMIARRYRDHGHPQFWGRITGTSGDVEDMQWMVYKFKKIGMTDVHIQPIDMPPQWIANSWSASVSGGGKTLPLSSAEVAYRTPATQGDGLDVEAVDADSARKLI
jgi:hypothetical protein